MSAVRAYRVLLRAYPASFRAAYGREMELLFRAQRRAAGDPLRFWAAIVWDVARTAPPLRLDALRARRRVHPSHVEAMMRAMAIVATLVGVLELGNALAESTAAIVVADGRWVAAVAMTVVAGLLLAAAGVALLRRGVAAGGWPVWAAAACLGLVVAAGLVQPWMSIVARVSGIVVPIALVVVLRRARGPVVPNVV